MRWKIGSQYLEQQLSKHQRIIGSLDKQIRDIRSGRKWWQRIIDMLTAGSSGERALRRQQNAAWQEMVKYDQGQSGEKRLFDALKRVCDDQYFYIAGFYNPGEKTRGDIDGVLIGPHGITVYEAKSFTGLFKIEQDVWWYHNYQTQGWEPAHGQPIIQVKQNIEILRSILQRHRLPIVPIYGVVALASDKTRLDPSSQSTVPIVFVHDARFTLQQLLGTGYAQTQVPETARNRLEIALSSIAKRS